MRTYSSRWAAAAGLVMTALGATSLGAQQRATVMVDNSRDVPVVVYLMAGPFDQRLGTVAAHQRASLALPEHLRDGEAITLIVHPEGHSDLYTPPGLHVKGGASIDLFVPTNDNGFVPPPPRETIQNPGPHTTTLTVENARGRPVDVFVEHGAFDTRIGTVAAHGEMTFHLPRSLANAEQVVDVFVHVEGGSDLKSERFQLRPDAHLLVKVPS